MEQNDQVPLGVVNIRIASDLSQLDGKLLTQRLEDLSVINLQKEKLGSLDFKIRYVHEGQSVSANETVQTRSSTLEEQSKSKAKKIKSRDNQNETYS